MWSKPRSLNNSQLPINVYPIFTSFYLVSPVSMFVCITSNLASWISHKSCDRNDTKFVILDFCKSDDNTLNWQWCPGGSGRMVFAGRNSSTVNGFNLKFSIYKLKKERNKENIYSPSPKTHKYKLSIRNCM